MRAVLSLPRRGPMVCRWPPKDITVPDTAKSDINNVCIVAVALDLLSATAYIYMYREKGNFSE